MSDIRWEGYSHEEIYAKVQQGPGRLASADAEAAWSTVESTIRAVDAQLTRAVNRIGAGWQGRAADAVHGGMTVMSNWALDAAGDATLTRNGITAQAEQAARLRTAMPPPHTAEWNRMVHEEIPAVGLMSATGDLGALEERMANDHAVAVDMMNRYSSQSSDNQRMMNYWTQPPAVVVEAVAPASSTGGVIGALGTAGAVAAATAIRPGAARAGPALDAPGRVEPDGGAAPPGVGGAASGGNGAATTAGTTPGPAGSGPGAAGAVPGPGARGSGATGPAGRPTPTGSTTGRAGAGAVGRPPAENPPAARGPLPGSAGGRPYANPPGGVRAIVPSPPAQAGTATDWRTGLRTAPVEPPAGPARPTAPGAVGVAEPAPRGAAIPAEGERAPASRTGTGHGFLPMTGATRPGDQEHRRPSYLVDDTDAFADDRWFPPPVISADAAACRA
jgi:hypothetical protein